MEIILGLLIIAAGSFCQSSSYVPIKKVRDWSWESFWLIQGVFAWLVFPLLGAMLAVPSGHNLIETYSTNPTDAALAVLFGVLWGVGGLTFGLSMRYLGVALGQSISLGTCAGLGTILTPLFMGKPGDLSISVIVGVIVTLLGIAIIGVAGSMKAKTTGETVKDFNFGKGIIVALIAGLMSACFSIGLGFGSTLCFEDTPEIYRTLPATFLVTLGGFFTNAAYCLCQNRKNKTFGDYGKTSLYLNNVLFCALAGLLWYSQFFGLALGKGFLVSSTTLLTFSWCILMSLNVTFSNVWGIILKEWQGTTVKTKAILVIGLIVLIISSFLPQII